MRWTRPAPGQYSREDGACVERKGSHPDRRYWVACRADGEKVRNDVLPSGRPYTPRAWHTERDKPLVRHFPTAKAAKEALDV